MGKGGAAEKGAGRGGAFAERLRGMREAAGLTQEELAMRAGLSPTAVSALERGIRRRPYPHTVRSLADALELSADERLALLAPTTERGVAPSVLVALRGCAARGGRGRRDLLPAILGGSSGAATVE